MSGRPLVLDAHGAPAGTTFIMRLRVVWELIIPWLSKEASGMYLTHHRVVCRAADITLPIFVQISVRIFREQPSIPNHDD